MLLGDLLEAVVRLFGTYHQACSCHTLTGGVASYTLSSIEQIALPTDEELNEAGSSHAGDWLLGFEALAPKLFADFVQSRKRTWRQTPSQRSWR